MTSRACINVASTQANNLKRLLPVAKFKPSRRRTMAPTPLEEALFMKQLLQGLDDDFFSAVPSPDPSPVKSKPVQSKSALPSTPTKPFLPLPSSTLLSASDHDAATFLQGSENWDLDDFSISPVKPSSSKLKADPHSFTKVFYNSYLSVEPVGYDITDFI